MVDEQILEIIMSLDAYKVLGLDRRDLEGKDEAYDPSVDKTVRSAYLKYARTLHPDSSGREANGEKFAEVSTAYKLLETRDQRINYKQANNMSNSCFSSSNDRQVVVFKTASLSVPEAKLIYKQLSKYESANSSSSSISMSANSSSASISIGSLGSEALSCGIDSNNNNNQASLQGSNNSTGAMSTISKGLGELYLKREEPKIYNAKLCFLLDITGSMQPVITAVKEFLLQVLEFCNTTYPNIRLQVGFVGYRDVEYSASQHFSVIHFTSDVSAFKREFERVSYCVGGEDEAEDVLGGLEQVLNMNWDHPNTRIKVLVHCGDSPHHGKLFHDPVQCIGDHRPQLESQPRHYSKIMESLADSRIDYTFVAVKAMHRNAFTTLKMLGLFAESYNSFPTRACNFAAAELGTFSPEGLFDKVKESLSRSILSFMHLQRPRPPTPSMSHSQLSKDPQSFKQSAGQNSNSKLSSSSSANSSNSSGTLNSLQQRLDHQNIPKGSPSNSVYVAGTTGGNVSSSAASSSFISLGSSSLSKR